jgi:signal transduction histidine kinase
MNCDHLRELKHELRTPVNHILGYSELLLETADDFGDNTVAVLARSIRARGQLLARLLEATLLSQTGEINDKRNELRSRVGPVIQDILAVSGSPLEMPSLTSYGQDLERIRLAAYKLMALVSGPEQGASGG